MTDFHVIERLPTVEEYAAFRAAVGWRAVGAEASARGLRNSLYSVVIEHHGEAVACGRIVGDGGVYFYVQDVVVLPPWQGRGLGRRVMDAVMAWLRAEARGGAFVGLMAAQGVAAFYERYGFAERAAGAPGMYLVMP